MKRSLVVVVAAAALFTVGCAHRRAGPVEPQDDFSATLVKPESLEVPATPDAIFQVQAALKKLSVKFAYDRDLLDFDGMSSLQRIAPVLRKNPAVKIQIAGHCDERGTEEYNLLLGQRRAEAARSYLVALGVDEPQLDTISYGAERPIDSQHSEEAWAANRRDDVAVKRVEQGLQASGSAP